jgi:hypothetical protein
VYVFENFHVLNPEQKLYWLLNNENEEILASICNLIKQSTIQLNNCSFTLRVYSRRTSWRKYVIMLLLNYRVHQATVQKHVKRNQEEIQIKPSNMCFSLNLFYLFRNIIKLYIIVYYIIVRKCNYQIGCVRSTVPWCF